MSIESDKVRCCASVCIGVPAHPVVWLRTSRHPAGKVVHVCSQFMKGVQCFVSILRGHVASSKGNMLCAAIMWLNVQPDACAIICNFPKSNMVSHALLHIHSNTSPGAIAALQVLRAVRFMAHIAWQSNTASPGAVQVSVKQMCSPMYAGHSMHQPQYKHGRARHACSREHRRAQRSEPPSSQATLCEGGPGNCACGTGDVWVGGCVGGPAGGGVHCPFHNIRTSPWKHTVWPSFLRPR